MIYYLLIHLFCSGVAAGWLLDEAIRHKANRQFYYFMAVVYLIFGPFSLIHVFGYYFETGDERRDHE